MSIYLYNTLTRKKESFMPLTEGHASMYHCGPTVYDAAHIGNLRAFVTADLLRRMFEFNGYEVAQVMNITDVDDKTIKRSRNEGVSLKELTEKYEHIFLNDSAALHILPPKKLVRATEHIDRMVGLIETLLEKGLAYKSADGSVYYKIENFENYGALARVDLSALKEGERVLHDEYEKENAHDFALWKAWSEDDGEVFWETPLGKGRPGWHIECSAMSMEYLGASFDVHTGGRDLIFPHHTNEIAQSEGATGKRFVRYWMHNEFLTVEGKKMSKSEGNIVTLHTIQEKRHTPLAYRYWLLTGHYRSLVNFTWEALAGAEHALQKLYDHYLDLGDAVGTAHSDYTAKLKKAINDDLDTPKAVALLWELVKDTTLMRDCKKATLLLFDETLGLGLAEKKREPVPLRVLELISARELAREKKDWEKADDLREQINRGGFSIDDTDEGTKVKPI